MGGTKILGHNAIRLHEPPDAGVVPARAVVVDAQAGFVTLPGVLVGHPGPAVARGAIGVIELRAGCCSARHAGGAQLVGILVYKHTTLPE